MEQERRKNKTKSWANFSPMTHSTIDRWLKLPPRSLFDGIQTMEEEEFYWFRRYGNSTAVVLLFSPLRVREFVSQSGVIRVNPKHICLPISGGEKQGGGSAGAKNHYVATPLFPTHTSSPLSLPQKFPFSHTETKKHRTNTAITIRLIQQKWLVVNILPFSVFMPNRMFSVHERSGYCTNWTFFRFN